MKKLIFLQKYVYLIKLRKRPMDLLNLSANEQAVLLVVQKEHLTSFQILKEVENVTMILSLYTILDDLNEKGVLKSYMKQNKKYHYAA